jgi:hypothetical protein
MTLMLNVIMKLGEQFLTGITKLARYIYNTTLCNQIHIDIIHLSFRLSHLSLVYSP